jgi:hypothetical protein
MALVYFGGGEEKDRAMQILKTCLFHDENTDY